MHYYIYCNSKTFGVNYQDAISEFTKRLSAYCDTTFLLQKNLYFPRDLTSNNNQFFQMVPGPSTYSSEEFARVIDSLQQSGKSNVHIIIGFSEEELYNALPALSDDTSPVRFSFTKCQLPAATLALLFYEQLYRGYTILHGKTYHK